MIDNKDISKFNFSFGMSSAIAEAFGINVLPNPTVGAAVLNIEGDVIATSKHLGKGTNHAELDIINKINTDQYKNNNLTLYTTLEPCFHSDTSPSCAKAIVDSKLFHKVVVGDIDPDIRTNGKGINFIKNNNINVEIEKNATKFLNPSYISSKTNKKVYIVAKLASSNDGYIHSNSQKGRYITNNYSLKLAHILRGTVDGVLVGKKTFLVDSPKLNVRYNLDVKQPIPLVLWGEKDNGLKDISKEYPYINFITSSNKSRNKNIIISKGNTTVDIMESLLENNIRSILIEGGIKTFNFFNNDDLIEIFYHFVANKKLGKGLFFDLDLSIKNKFTLDHTSTYSEDRLSIYKKI